MVKLGSVNLIYSLHSISNSRTVEYVAIRLTFCSWNAQGCTFTACSLCTASQQTEFTDSNPSHSNCEAFEGKHDN